MQKELHRFRELEEETSERMDVLHARTRQLEADLVNMTANACSFSVFKCVTSLGVYIGACSLLARCVCCIADQAPAADHARCGLCGHVRVDLDEGMHYDGAEETGFHRNETWK